MVDSVIIERATKLTKRAVEILVEDLTEEESIQWVSNNEVLIEDLMKYYITKLS